MSKRKLKTVRIIAAFMLLSILNQLFFPSVALALTSMDTQPEVWGYQAVDATDNVSLVSGKFNYTVPITSIPEFPMAIGYNAGMGMDQEASVFGFGFNGFSGAITRSLNGLPDDLNGVKEGARKEYEFSNEAMIDVNMKTTFTVGFNWTDYVSVGASTSQIYGFNNYTGAYGAVSMGLGAGIRSKSAGTKTGGVTGQLGLGVEFMNDSRESAPRFGAGAGLSIAAWLQQPDADGKTGPAANQSLSLAGVYASKTLDGQSKWQTGGSALGGQFTFGKQNFNSTPGTVSSTVGSLAYVFPRRGGTTVSMSTGSIPWCMCSAATLWSKYKFFESEQSKKSYGYMYLDGYDRADKDCIADMAIEGEDSYNENAFNNPSYLQKDNYSVNTMGMSGGMELYQRSFGMVSRNYTSSQTNKRNTYSVKTEINSVNKWTNASQLGINKSADILSVLSSAATADYEVEDLTNSAFELMNDLERQNFNDASRKFVNDPVFKMRGDMAGEYDMASEAYDDHDVNAYNLLHITGTSSDPKFAWLGVEKNVPIYYPQANRNFHAYAAANKIKTSTYIKKNTVNSLLTAVPSSLLTVDPTLPGSASASPLDPFNFNQSFYCHYKYNPTGSKSDDVVLNSNMESMNILKHIKDLRADAAAATGSTAANSYFNDLIGSFEMQSVNGLRYYFNLPVFNKVTKSVQLSGKGVNPPVASSTDYNSMTRDGKTMDRNKMSIEDKFMYPYAWMLTAIVGDDYIDFDKIPGPSDGDIGYWVKFKYVRTADNYKWRGPFEGMEYMPGMVHNYGDDSYSVVYGEKEIYCLSEIESSNYLCKYNYQKRFDGVDANKFANGDAFNTLTDAESYTGDMTGDNFQFVVTQIDLYKKHSTGDNSEEITTSSPKIIKSTKFLYDYSTCKQVPNNYQMYASTPINKEDLTYHIDYDPVTGSPISSGEDIESGKLTLRKVQHIAYDETGNIATASYLPSYEFNYYGDTDDDYNPDYDRHCVDQWGNYMANAKNDGDKTNDGIYYYKNYTEYVKSEADENAKVFKLKTIKLPSGGSMEINYAAQSYGYVEDAVPYVMRNIVQWYDAGTDKTTLIVDVTDLGGLGLDVAEYTTAKGDKKAMLTPGDIVYGEMCFYRSPELDPANMNEANTAVINEEAIVDAIDPTVTTSFGRKYQEVTLRSQDNDDYSGDPFINQAKMFMYHESVEAKILQDHPGTPTTSSFSDYLDEMESYERDTPFDAVTKIIAHGNHMLKKPSTFESDYNNAWGDPFVTTRFFHHWSYLRTPIYKGKYTGSVVSSIRLKDGFNYATQANGTVGTTENEYGTNYVYDIDGDGTSTSSGVATNEPGGGKSCVKDLLKTTGAGFMASPTIISGKTTMVNLYHAPEQGASNGDRVSRDKGRTSYEFYTPKDDGMQFGDRFKQTQFTEYTSPICGNFFLFGIINFKVIKWHLGTRTITIKIPKFIPIIMKWKLEDKYHTRAYAYTDYTDIFGRLKKIHQIDANGLEIGSQSYNYYGMDEAVPVYKNSFSSTEATDQKPGKVDQAWAEAYYSRTDNLHSIPPLFLLNAKTKKDFCYTGMKYSYIPPVLKEVVSTIDGLTTTTSYSGFDYYTGTAIEAKSYDSYENQKISRTVPAYWNYPEMGPRSEVDDQLNNLTATTGTYMYLNTVSNSNLTGAGVVKFTDGPSKTWDIIPYIQPKRTYVSSTSYNYMYSEVAGNTIRSGYNLAQRTSDKYIKRNAHIYKPYKGYTYEVPLNFDGTGRFATFTPFSYSSTATNPKWKQLTTNQRFSQNGVLVQSSDVLSKYASQLLGYNFSNTIAAVSNASWGACAYEGAENSYAGTVTPIMLENNKVAIKDATIVEACERTYLSKTLSTSTFPHPGGGSLIQANVVTITLPTIPTHNVPFAKLNITYAHDPTLSRIFYISLDDGNHFSVMSNLGETFDGYFVYPQAGGTYKLLFNPNDFSSMTLDSGFTPSGYTVAYGTASNLPDCNLTKPYQVPENDCANVHTGRYAFQLEPGVTGTDFLLSSNPGGNVTIGEFKRKYKALVWVSNTSPANTELVMQVTNSGGVTLLMPEQSTSLATPYAVAGEWSLLRLDFDLSSLPVSSPYVHVFLRNSSANGYAIYDDFRVLPYHADMTNWVFDHNFNRVTSGLDVDNFASYSAYDNRGRVTSSKVELQDSGKKTVQKFIYNDQKIN